MADVPYEPGNICDNRGNPIHSILLGRGMHTLGAYALVRTLVSSLDGCLGVVRITIATRQGCGGCSAGMGYGRQTRCRGGD